MDVSPEIAFRGVDPSDELKSAVLEGIDRLEEVYQRLVSCRVMVENATPGRHTGNVYRVRLDISVPHHSIVVDREPPTEERARDAAQAIKEAFDTARRKLNALKEKQRGDVKTQGLPPHGRVVRLLSDDNGVRYGFLISRGGREIYFHENALVGLAYDDLDVGTEVRFAESRGDQGPQASTVAALNHDQVGPRQEDSMPLNSPRH